MTFAPEVTSQELGLIAGYVRQLSGIDLDDSKGYLVEGRLGPLLAEMNCSSYLELYQRARADGSGALADRLVDAISTKETSFFRDRTPFELLRMKLLPEYVRRVEESGGLRRLHVWSAASSTGQEAYSIAMLIDECLPHPATWQVGILGTDISEPAVARARAGVYSQQEVTKGLSQDQVRRYFTPHEGGWQVCEELKERTFFRQINLMELPPEWGIFDLVFCRNVAIYFSLENRTRLFDRIADHLRPGGSLIIGSTESLHGISERYRMQRESGATFYQLEAGVVASAK
ncbi:MAG: protein-glutamate O-methyltransferase CheR [Gemmatimonadetes bacterium]|jgi:chemotaxis protein methyltransferase CheR|nr:protein-glutamate O-methyltransferase CheR [Gemmatimonadota bacterium]